MSIFIRETNGIYCTEIDEFDDYTEYPIDCAVLASQNWISLRVATLPPQEWIDDALGRYYEYERELESQAAADILEIDISEYYVLFPDANPGSYVFGDAKAAYIADPNNQPVNVQAFVDLIRSLELGI